MKVPESLAYPNVNRVFTFACFISPPIFGSAVSFIFNGGAIWCMIEILFGTRPARREPHVIALTAVLWAYALSRIFSAMINGVLEESAGGLIGLFTLAVFPFSYSVWSISRKDEIVRACLTASALACYGALAFALYEASLNIQYINTGFRAEGAAGNALVFGTVTTVLSGISLIGLFAADRRRAIFFGVAFLAGSAAVVFSSSRGILPALVLNAIIVACLWSRTGRISARAWSVIALALICVGALSVVLLSTRIERIVAEWRSMAIGGDYESSIGIRMALWQVAWDIWREKPFFGYGAGPIPALISERLNSDYGIPEPVNHFHNAYLHALVEAGVFGLMTTLAVLLAPVVVVLRAFRRGADSNAMAGVTIVLVSISTFAVSGLSNLMLGHDILDAMFMISLVAGVYLAAGTSGEHLYSTATPRETG